MADIPFHIQGDDIIPYYIYLVNLHLISCGPILSFIYSYAWICDRDEIPGCLVGNHSITRRGWSFSIGIFSFHFLSGELHFFNTLPQAKYIFQFVCGDKYLLHFLRIFFLSIKLDPKLDLSLFWKLKIRAKRGFTSDTSQIINYFEFI